MSFVLFNFCNKKNNYFFKPGIHDKKYHWGLTEGIYLHCGLTKTRRFLTISDNQTKHLPDWVYLSVHIMTDVFLWTSNQNIKEPEYLEPALNSLISNFLVTKIQSLSGSCVEGYQERPLYYKIRIIVSWWLELRKAVGAWCNIPSRAKGELLPATDG